MTMRAVTIENPGKSSRLVIEDYPIPKPAKGEVLINVKAAGVNRPDLVQRLGHYAPPPGITHIPGLEIAGDIVDANGHDHFNNGDKVMALVAGGGYAEYCIAPVEQVLPFPRQDMSYSEAAGIPETFFTVWTNLFDSAHLQRGETILIHGGSSGIGTTAIQIAKLYDCTVIITAGSDKKCQACEALGADLAINYKTDDFVQSVAEFTKGQGCNVILDMVGGGYVNRNLKCLAPFGRHVSIAMLDGKTADIDIFRVMKNRLTLTGSTLRARPVNEKAKIAQALYKNIWPAFQTGKIKPVIDSVFDFQDVEAAHQKMIASTHIGKIILKL